MGAAAHRLLSVALAVTLGAVAACGDDSDGGGGGDGDSTTTTEPSADVGLDQITVINDPVADGGRIRELVGQGFLVRTRTDADTVEARSGDTRRREAAFASGAQIVSTDYEREDPRFPGFVVALPGGGPARCNPVNAPDDCNDQDFADG